MPNEPPTDRTSRGFEEVVEVTAQWLMKNAGLLERPGYQRHDQWYFEAWSQLREELREPWRKKARALLSHQCATGLLTLVEERPGWEPMCPGCANPGRDHFHQVGHQSEEKRPQENAPKVGPDDEDTSSLVGQPEGEPSGEAREMAGPELVPGHHRAAQRLLDAKGSIHAAFDSLELGFDHAAASDYLNGTPTFASFTTVDAPHLPCPRPDARLAARLAGLCMAFALTAVEADRLLAIDHPQDRG